MRAINGRPRFGLLTRRPALEWSAVGDIDMGTSRCPPGERFLLRIITALRSGEIKKTDFEADEDEEEPEEKDGPAKWTLGLRPSALTLEIVPAPL